MSEDKSYGALAGGTWLQNGQRIGEERPVRRGWRGRGENGGPVNQTEEVSQERRSQKLQPLLLIKTVGTKNSHCIWQNSAHP